MDEEEKRWCKWRLSHVSFCFSSEPPLHLSLILVPSTVKSRAWAVSGIMLKEKKIARHRARDEIPWTQLPFPFIFLVDQLLRWVSSSSSGRRPPTASDPQKDESGKLQVDLLSPPLLACSSRTRPRKEISWSRAIDGSHEAGRLYFFSCFPGRPASEPSSARGP